MRALSTWGRSCGREVKLFGIDVDANFAALAEKHLKADGFDVSILHCSATNLTGVSDGRYDFVVSSNMIHHIRSREAVAEVFRQVARISAAGFLFVDLDRRLIGLPLMAAGILAGGSWSLAVDGIRSVRRSYRHDEIRGILNNSAEQFGCKKLCCEYSALTPYWWVTGQKR